MTIKQYPPKILVALSQALTGKQQFTDWLLANGYPELGMLVYALHNKHGARNWLMENGYQHWMAVVNGAEGNEIAQKWLKNFGFDILYHVARSGDGWIDSQVWLKEQNQKEFFMVALAIKQLKNYIDLKNNDPHRFGQDS